MGFIKKNLKRLQQVKQSIGKSDSGLEVTADIQNNLDHLSAVYGNSQELHREIFHCQGKDFGLAYLESVIDLKILQEKLNNLLQKYSNIEENKALNLPLLMSAEKTQAFSSIIDKLAQGYAVLFKEGEKDGLLLPAPLQVCREPIQPEEERSIFGPKDGFVEDIQTNLFLIRSKLKDAHLRIRKITVGTRTKSVIHVLYLEDLAQPEIVDTVIRRIEAVEVDEIIYVGELAQYLQDSWLSPFPQTEHTRRPDIVAASLCQGRVAILHNSSPGVLLAPTTFFDLIDVPDDYYNAWSVSSSIIRFIRLVSIFLAIFIPSFYIALTAYNPDFIPSSLAFLIAASREGVPFPTPIEAFLLVSILEITREATLKMDRVKAQIIGIVALLIITGALVFANLISATMVIIIGIGSICSSVVPDYDTQISVRELQFFFMIMASVLGIFGVAMAFFYTAIHLVTLKSFGIPFMSPMAPLNPRDWLRILFRFPAWTLPRLKSYHAIDQDRVANTADRLEGEPVEKDTR